MHKNVTKCNKILSKWCKNKHGASKIIDTFDTYHSAAVVVVGMVVVVVVAVEKCFRCYLALHTW
jgi:hypothetical protein